MKKIIKLVSSIALLAAMGIPMTACSKKNVEKISPLSEYAYSYNAALKQSNWTVKTNDVTFLDSDGAGTAIVKETKIENFDEIDTYRLFNLATASLVDGIQSEDALHVLDKGLFYSIKTTDADGQNLASSEYTYTLYSATAVLISNVKGKIDHYQGIFTQEDGTRWYVDYSGTVKQEKNPFAMLFTDYHLQIGKKYIQFVNGYTRFYIYDKDGKFEKAFDLYNELTISANTEIVSYWRAGDALFLQTETMLPETEKTYDYTKTVNGVVQKFDLNTYSYSVKSDKLSEVKNFDYLIDDVYSDYEVDLDYVILEVQEIVDQQINEQVVIQAFDQKGNIHFDIQKLVSGADGISFCGEYVLLEDAIGMTYVYKKKDLVMTIPADSINFNYTNSNKIYYTLNSMLYIYDLDSQSVIKTVANVNASGETAQGNIWYTVYDSDNQTTQYNVYNVDTGAVTLENTLTEGKQYLYYGDFGNTYCITASIADLGTTYTLSFPDSSIEDLTSNMPITVVKTYNVYEQQNTSYTEYTVFYVQSKDTDSSIISNYYVLTETSAITEKD